MSKRVILTISGAPASGKSTLEKKIIEKYGNGKIRTLTTRSPREGETEESFDFKTEKEMDSLKDLLWKISIHGNVYAGRDIEFKTAYDRNPSLQFIVITPELHSVISKHFSNDDTKVISVHLLSPSLEILEKRLLERGESEESTQRRLCDAVDMEKSAQELSDINFIKPGTKEQTFKEISNLIGLS